MMEEADRQYNGEFRHVNLGPAQVRRRLAIETDPDERAALLTALRFWERKAPEREVVAGQSSVPEPREVIHAGSMMELAKRVKPVKHVFVRGTVDDHGASMGVPAGVKDGESIIDWDMLKDGGSDA